MKEVSTEPCWTLYFDCDQLRLGGSPFLWFGPPEAWFFIFYTSAEGFSFLSHFLDKTLQTGHIYQVNISVFTTWKNENVVPRGVSAKDEKASGWLSPCVLYVFFLSTEGVRKQWFYVSFPQSHSATTYFLPNFVT